MPLAVNNLFFEYLTILPLFVIAAILLAIFVYFWVLYITYRYLVSQKWSLLEIIAPREIKVSPKAMEQLLAGFHGMVKLPTLIEVWIQGFSKHRFSLEFLGRNGEMHFLIRVQKEYTSLAKANIYAQYPDAEIIEVKDYSKEIPVNVPNRDWDLWGTEFRQTNRDWSYPIRTYKYFEDKLADEENIDPMASIAEVFSHLKLGEQMWVQIVCTATHEKWQEQTNATIAKLAGKPESALKGSWADRVDNFFQWLVWEPRKLFGMIVPQASKKEEKAALPSRMQYLTEGEKATIAAIEEKSGKFGFNAKIRFIYAGKREAFSRAILASFLGAWKQFSTLDLNGFMPDFPYTTAIRYLMKNLRLAYRQRRILMRYRSRSVSGTNPYILNIEELATLFHFPSAYAKAPGLARVEAKRGSAPANLPV